jgi:hypothetical protein
VADLHHGFANGLMIEPALRFNLQAVPERFRIMAQAVGLEGDGEAFLRWLSDLKRRIGIPRGPAEAGVKPEERGRLAELAFADTCHLNNPRSCTPEDFRRLWDEAFASAAPA